MIIIIKNNKVLQTKYLKFANYLIYIFNILE